MLDSTLTILLTFIFFMCVGFLYTEGMWSNAVRLVNVITAALLATNFWEPAAGWLEGFNSTYTFFWDFLALWGLFALFMLAFRGMTDAVSRVKVRFPKAVDTAGGCVFAAGVGWVMVCFIMMTLHTAPLAKNFLFGSFQSDQRMFFGLAPDRQWLGFAQRQSLGTFSRLLTQEEMDQKPYGAGGGPAWQDDLAVFDRGARFIPKYLARRVSMEEYMTTKKATRVLESDMGGQIPKRQGN